MPIFRRFEADVILKCITLPSLALIGEVTAETGPKFGVGVTFVGVAKLEVAVMAGAHKTGILKPYKLKEISQIEGLHRAALAAALLLELNLKARNDNLRVSQKITKRAFFSNAHIYDNNRFMI